MATRKLLVLIDNVPGELPLGDDVDLSFSVSAGAIIKKMLVDSNPEDPFAKATILCDNHSVLYEE
jgi:hypothetical protein